MVYDFKRTREMNTNTIQLSKEFKTQAIKAIIAIFFFAFTYIILLLLAVVATVLCIAGGVFLIALKPMFFTIALGIGLASLGILILIFLLKFIFNSHKSDRSHLIEINKTDEPDLFHLIKEIVEGVKTSYPKKVYLSSDVNASVFYDSNFWSMFFPIKKNLVIGLGLVNTVTKEELKAILSHEFGHFSQRTMKVGSYVYNVNQVIFNMLYENESYYTLINSWANVSGYFSIFVIIANKINEGIQWVLRKLYEVVNKSYMGLSREMEFHADEIAASITGYEPLKNSLLRMTLADNSYNGVLHFYNGKLSENIKSENIYRDQTSIFKFLAEVNNFNIKNDLPSISLEEQSKFDKSKLVIKDQWASHPTTKERIKRLEKTGFLNQSNDATLANNVFKDIVETQKQLTAKLFEGVKYEGETKVMGFENFQNEYRNETLSNSFSKIYNGYYDNKNPAPFDLNEINSIHKSMNVHELFSDEKVDLVYTAIGLQNDIETLKNISNNAISIKTFDYDGMRYKKKDAEDLAVKLKIELDTLNEQITRNDMDIYECSKRIEVQQNTSKHLEHLYLEFFEFDKTFDTKYEIYLKLLKELEFVNTTTPFEQIKANLDQIKPIEILLKSAIKDIMANAICQTEISNEIRSNLESYLSNEWSYFNTTHYHDDNLNILYTAMNNYAFILSRSYFLMKKKILKYQEELITNHTHHDIC